jgi:DNA-binding protein Alba
MEAVGEVFVGKKPAMNYVTATLLQLAEKSKICVKARGRMIAKAVTVAEMVKRFNKNVDVESIKIGSEERTMENVGRTRYVSTIEITLSKKEA